MPILGCALILSVFALVFLIGVAISAGIGFIAMLALNALLPLFGVAVKVTFFQAWAATWLLGLITGWSRPVVSVNQESK